MPGIFSKRDLAASFPVAETAVCHPTRAIYVKDGTELALTRKKVEIARFVGESVRAGDRVLLVGVWDGGQGWMRFWLCYVGWVVNQSESFRA